MATKLKEKINEQVDYTEIEYPDRLRVDGCPSGLVKRWEAKRELPFARRMGWRDATPEELKKMTFGIDFEHYPEFTDLRFQVMSRDIYLQRQAKHEHRNKQAELNIKAQMVNAAHQASKALIKAGKPGNVTIRSEGHGFKQESMTIGRDGEIQE